MADNLRVALDILALLAVTFAIVRGYFMADKDNSLLKAQVSRNSSWIEGHEQWSQAQTREIQKIREDIAYIRGKYEAAVVE